MVAKFKVKVDEPLWLKYIREKQRPVALAAVAALRETAANAVQEGRRDIASAGAFGAKWQRDLQYRTFDAVEAGEPSLQAKAVVFHKSALAGVFEQGVTIQGKPLLWIPTTPKGPPASRWVRKTKKKLVSATVRGQPMLFDATDRDRDRKPLYIGVPAVRIAKKWHITEIVKKHAAQIAFLFIKHFKGS